MRTRRSKFNAKPTVVDGIRFASQKEARCWRDLRALEMIGEISSLKVQPRFRLEVNGIKICDYVADFDYFDRIIQSRVIADAKGMKTPVYRLKAKLMKAIHGIEIREL